LKKLRAAPNQFLLVFAIGDRLDSPLPCLIVALPNISQIPVLPIHFDLAGGQDRIRAIRIKLFAIGALFPST
jgi:hypothetical protein